MTRVNVKSMLAGGPGRAKLRIADKLARRRYFVHSAFWVVIGDLSSKLLGILFIVGLSRIYSKDLFGQYTLVLGSIGLVTVFNLAGVSNAIVQSVARGFKGTFRRAVHWTVLCSVIGSVFLAAYGVYQLEVKQDTSLFWGFLVASLTFPAAYGLEQWSQYWEGEQQFKRLAIQQIVRWSVTYTAIVSAAWLWPSKIVYSLLVLFLLRSMFNLMYTRSILSAIEPDAVPEEGTMHYGLRTSVYGGVNRIANHLDKVFLYEFASAEVLAVYFVADKVAELTKESYQNITGIFVPRYSRMKGFSEAAERNIEIVGVVMVIGIMGFAVFVVPWLLPVVFSEVYQASVIYCQALLLSMCIGVLATLKYAFIRSKLDIEGFRNVNLVPNGVRILLIVLLVPMFGMSGAVGAAVGYRITLLFVTNSSLRKHRLPKRAGDSNRRPI